MPLPSSFNCTAFLAHIALHLRLHRFDPLVNRYPAIKNFIRCLEKIRRYFVVVSARRRRWTRYRIFKDRSQARKPWRDSQHSLVLIESRPCRQPCTLEITA
jgi:hypothetical protein